MPSDLTPIPDPDAHLEDVSSELQDIGVSRDLQALLNRGLTTKSLPRQMRTKRAADAFQQAFDIIGGVPRLALWADRNPDKFFQLYGRLIGNAAPPPTGQDITANEMAWVSARRLMYQMGAKLADDIEAKRVDTQGD